MNRRGLTGFTLIELIMTVAIIGLLAMLTLPMVELSVHRSKEQELRLALREIRDALDSYKQAVVEGHIPRSIGKSDYPETLQILVEGVADAKSPSSDNKIYFLRRIPRDPMTNDNSKANDETWGKRSYSSSAEDPQEGNDVFDVYSLSDATGMNGVPYRKW
jgi:general secretion pathway protein G